MPSTSCTAGRFGPSCGPASLVAAAVIGLVAAVGLGVVGVTKTGWVLVPFIVVGPLIVIAYNAELFGGVVHNDVGFAAAWGAFPVLTAYVAQTKTLALAPVLAAFGAFASFDRPAAPQHSGTSPAPTDRARGEGTVDSGRWRGRHRSTGATSSAPLEGALAALSWSTVLFATALAVARLT